MIRILCITFKYYQDSLKKRSEFETLFINSFNKLINSFKSITNLDNDLFFYDLLRILPNIKKDFYEFAIVYANFKFAFKTIILTQLEETLELFKKNLNLAVSLTDVN